MSIFGFEGFSRDLTVPPPLPRHLTPRLAEGVTTEDSRDWLASVRRGCYYLSCEIYEPQEPDAVVAYLGTLRLEVDGTSILASGDLYVANQELVPSPSMGIPVFPIEDYRTYLRVEQITLEGNGDAHFEVATYAFDNRSWWRRKETWGVRLRRIHGPSNYPSSPSYFQGDVLDKYENGIGTVRMGWVSPMLRRARLQLETIGHVPPLPRGVHLGPEGREVTWKSVFAQVGWDLQVSDSRVAEVARVDSCAPIRSENGSYSLGTKQWREEELHQELIRLHEVDDDGRLLDREWRYYLFCIDQYSDPTYRGIMFDSDFNMGNKLPREGAAIAAGFMFPKGSGWGELKETKLYQSPELYFRTAVHELGHAMGMVHQTEASGDLGFMTTLDDIKALLVKQNSKGRAASSPSDKKPARPRDLPATTLRRALKWEFAPKDSLRLRHFPDYVVRPGGQPFAGQVWRLSSRRPIPNPASSALSVNLWSNDASRDDQLSLRVAPHPESRVLPLGAPVRLELQVRNHSAGTVAIPSLKLSHTHLTVMMQGPAGVERRIQPLVHVTSKSEAGSMTLGSSEFQAHALTLAWGDRGYLFPGPGQYQIQVRWLRSRGNRAPYLLTGKTTVLVRDEVFKMKDGTVLRALMSNPDVLKILAFGGSEYVGGSAEETLNDALGFKVLAPHYRYIVLEHRLRSGQPLQHALKGLHLGKGIIMTSAEIRRLRERLQEQSPGKLPESLTEEGLEEQERAIEGIWADLGQH